MSPPTAEMRPTPMAQARESRRSTGCPSAKAHCRIAIAAAAKARIAAEVCTRSCQVKNGPGTGTGHPDVQVTCESTRKNAHATQSEIAGAQAPITRARDRMPRPAQATRAPPATMSSRNTSNGRAVGMPVAPSSLT